MSNPQLTYYSQHGTRLLPVSHEIKEPYLRPDCSDQVDAVGNSISHSLTKFTGSVDPGQTVVTMAKLQNPVKSSFDSVNDNLKEVHSGLNKYTKALDKVLGPRPLYPKSCSPRFFSSSFRSMI